MALPPLLHPPNSRNRPIHRPLSLLYNPPSPSLPTKRSPPSPSTPNSNPRSHPTSKFLIRKSNFRHPSRMASVMFAKSRIFWLLAMSRVLQGLSAAIVNATGLAMVVDIVGFEKLGMTMGTVSFSTSSVLFHLPLTISPCERGLRPPPPHLHLPKAHCHLPS